MKDIDEFKLQMAIDKLQQAASLLKQGGMPAKSLRINAIISDAQMTIKENRREDK